MWWIFPCKKTFFVGGGCCVEMERSTKSRFSIKWCKQTERFHFIPDLVKFACAELRVNNPDYHLQVEIRPWLNKPVSIIINASISRKYKNKA